MGTATLGELIGRHGVDVLEHLDRQVEVPVLDGLQFQGDLAVIPDLQNLAADRAAQEVPAAGIAVIEAVGGGHEHRLLPTGELTMFAPLGGGQDLGVLVTTAPAYLAHPEHGYLGIAPGSYLLRRQREQADEERLVAD
jgi:hypothetical protein